MTVFVCKGTGQDHRLGITASRKLSGKAVERNRARRLLRETFRLSLLELEKLEGCYDWVFNAKRALLTTKVDAPLAEFKHITMKIAADESGRCS